MKFENTILNVDDWSLKDKTNYINDRLGENYTLFELFNEDIISSINYIYTDSDGYITYTNDKQRGNFKEIYIDLSLKYGDKVWRADHGSNSHVWTIENIFYNGNVSITNEDNSIKRTVPKKVVNKLNKNDRTRNELFKLAKLLNAFLVVDNNSKLVYMSDKKFEPSVFANNIFNLSNATVLPIRCPNWNDYEEQINQNGVVK